MNQAAAEKLAKIMEQVKIRDQALDEIERILTGEPDGESAADDAPRREKQTKRTNLTPSVVRKIIFLHEKGMSTIQISAETGVSKSAVYYQIKKNNGVKSVSRNAGSLAPEYPLAKPDPDFDKMPEVKDEPRFAKMSKQDFLAIKDMEYDDKTAGEISMELDLPLADVIKAKSVMFHEEYVKLP